MRRIEHYEPVSFPLDPPDEAFLEALPDVLAAELARGRLRSVADVDGREGLDALAALSDEARYGLYSTMRGWARGAEIDLLVDTGGGPKPVTVWWSTRGDARVAWGEAEPERASRPASVDLAAWTARIASRTGTGGFTGVPWTEVEVGDVALALERLTPEERETLAGVVIERLPTSPRRATRELAFFDPTFEPPTLQFYDIAFGDDHLGFVGPCDRPIASGAMTALHEFGHVLADAPLRRAFVAYLRAWEAWTGTDRGAAARAVERAAWRSYRDLGRDGPVIEAWEALRAGRRGPSSFGFANRHESFAEAFALYHLDPDALERALPGAVEWFASGAHVAAARQD